MTVNKTPSVFVSWILLSTLLFLQQKHGTKAGFLGGRTAPHTGAMDRFVEVGGERRLEDGNITTRAGF